MLPGDRNTYSVRLLYGRPAEYGNRLPLVAYVELFANAAAYRISP